MVGVGLRHCHRELPLRPTAAASESRFHRLCVTVSNVLSLYLSLRVTTWLSVCLCVVGCVCVYVCVY